MRAPSLSREAQLDSGLPIGNIRAGTPLDAKALAELIARFQPTLTIDPSGAGAERYLASVSESAERQYLESSRYSFLLAEPDGQVVGFIAMRDKWHLFHLFVAPEYQRQGIARALWRQAQELALEEAATGDYTVNASLNAVPVYERFGFLPAGSVVRAHGIAFQPMRHKRS